MVKELSKEEVDFIRLQMLYNISNGWSWFAYKRLGPKGIIEVELEMWENLLPPAVDLLVQLIAPEGTSIEKAKYLINQVSKINGYELKYLEETPKSLKWEYTVCPNWNSLVQLDYEDYLSRGGKPAKVSCIHGCAAVHKNYFKKIDPQLKVQSLKNRPNADETCIFQITK
ncbi:MAG: hypothetical protein QW261_15545 [Candidatus Jordarchaeaceae archaeon]